jgi:hypothetical protein
MIRGQVIRTERRSAERIPWVDLAALLLFALAALLPFFPIPHALFGRIAVKFVQI